MRNKGRRAGLQAFGERGGIVSATVADDGLYGLVWGGKRVVRRGAEEKTQPPPFLYAIGAAKRVLTHTFFHQKVLFSLPKLFFLCQK